MRAYNLTLYCASPEINRTYKGSNIIKTKIQKNRTGQNDCSCQHFQAIFTELNSLPNVEWHQKSNTLIGKTYTYFENSIFLHFNLLVHPLERQQKKHFLFKFTKWIIMPLFSEIIRHHRHSFTNNATELSNALK